MQERHRSRFLKSNAALDDYGSGAELGVYLKLNEEVFGPAGTRRLLDAEAFCRETGLNESHWKSCSGPRLLLPLDEGRFDAEDVRMGRMYLDALHFGIRARDLSYYADLGEKDRRQKWRCATG